MKIEIEKRDIRDIRVMARVTESMAQELKRIAKKNKVSLSALLYFSCKRIIKEEEEASSYE